jgi:hypothetical protein
MVAQEHMSYVDAIRYGTARTEATIQAATAAIGSAKTTLVLTFAGDGVWVIGNNTVIATTTTLKIPAGVTVSVSGGITFTVNGPILADQAGWKTGPGTLARGLTVATELSYLQASRVLVTNDTTDAIVVRGAIATAAAVRLFVEQGGGNAGLSLSRTDASSASSWSIVTGAGGSLAFARPGASSNMLLTDSGLGVGLGMVPNATIQSLTDNVYKPTAGGWLAAVSNARFKQLLEEFTDGLEQVRQLTPRWYEFTGEVDMPTGQRFLGLIADEVEPIAPYMLHAYEAQWGPEEARQTTPAQALDITPVTYMLVNALKEIDQRLTALEHGGDDEVQPVHRARRRREGGA